TPQGNRVPKGRQRILVIIGILFTNSLSPLRGSPNPPNHYPRRPKPHLGLNSAAATQLICAATGPFSQRDKDRRNNCAPFADTANQLTSRSCQHFPSGAQPAR